MTSPLPIDAVLPQLLHTLDAHTSAVLVAPPGAGKTTRVPLAMLAAAWRQEKKILLLSPRRLAARAAAQRMADTLGEPVGQTVGYRMRLESKISAATKIEVITQALLTRLILDQPDLPDIAAILFDEFHERSLDGDIGLALALDVQANLREDLRILPMSATLDGARVSSLLNNAPVIESQGRMFPVTLRHEGRDARAPLEPQIVRTIQRALRDETGSLLVFLPGAAEINRTARLLSDAQFPAHVSVHPLMGQLELRDQQAAISPAKPGTRKIVLATAIAETSLTIEGVRVVIDSGLSRRAQYDAGSALSKLVTGRVSQASATQRAGRAGRLEPGVCYRLWDEPENRGLQAYDPPEILAADLSSLVLTLAAWGTHDPAQVRWLDVPPAGAWAQAVALLQNLAALDGQGRITAHGKKLSDLATHPRVAHMLVTAAENGQGKIAADIAALLSEPGVGGRSADLRVRLETLQRDKTQRAENVRRLAHGWAKTIGAKNTDGTVEEAGAVLALAYPDRIARARGGRGSFLLANGKGAMVDETDALARQSWLVIADMAGSADRARILLAAEIDETDVMNVAKAQITLSQEARIEGKSNRSEVVEIKKLGAITLSEKRLDNPPPEIIQAALLNFIRQKGVHVLPWSDHWMLWRTRVAFLHTRLPENWPNVDDTNLLSTLDIWLAEYLTGKSRLTDFSADDLGHALTSILPGNAARDLERLAPPRFTTPAGSSHVIDYTAQGGPSVECRVQEVYGIASHPCVAQNIPLTFILLSPGHKPIQTTRDLPGFWRGSWSAVKSEMKGRYPRHLWPDDPAAAQPTTRAKPRGT
jgi:ATP-dependent helicase HrpB